jgi:hypothetical protein
MSKRDRDARGVTACRWVGAAVLPLAVLGAAVALEIGRGSDVAVGSVQVRRVVKVHSGPDAATGYSIDYSYVFPGRDLVHVKNLGIVPGKGSFQYISGERELQFRDAASGEILQTVPFEETIVAAGDETSASDIPREREFPPEFRSFPWTATGSFQERANAIFNEYFRYWPREYDKKTYLTTTFTPLEWHNPPAGVLGQTALLLSFPFESTGRGFYFHVQLIVREGRTHSDKYLPTKNASMVAAANQFVNRLVVEMNGGRHR